MKPIAWHDPSNGVVSTDRDCPLFTPLGQVWPLCLKRTWVGLTDEEIETIADKVANENFVGVVPNFRVRFARSIEQALKERNQ